MNAPALNICSCNGPDNGDGRSSSNNPISGGGGGGGGGGGKVGASLYLQLLPQSFFSFVYFFMLQSELSGVNLFSLKLLTGFFSLNRSCNVKMH